MPHAKNLILAICVICIIACEEEKPNNTCIDKDKIREGACTNDYTPVCGCNGKTYPNACAADLSGVTLWTGAENVNKKAVHLDSL